MRDIRFRAYRKDGFDANKSIMQYGIERATVGNIDTDCEDFESYLDGYADELMQYTGLHDADGNEIYEGDILKDNGNKSWVCIFEKYRNGWAITEMNEYGSYGYYIENATPQKVRERKLIIVGNIYEGVKDDE